jgi:hypothetical protein
LLSTFQKIAQFCHFPKAVLVEKSAAGCDTNAKLASPICHEKPHYYLF